MTTLNCNYSLDLFNSITFNGFNYQVPAETINIISEIALEVGAPTYVKTPVFQKRNERQLDMKNTNNNNGNGMNYKKKRGNKHMENMGDEDWDTSVVFKSTVIEQKTGIGAHIDTIRTYLNKITDKNCVEYKAKVLDLLAKLQLEHISLEDLTQISEQIFQFASTNRFYSKIYAELYADIITHNEIMRQPFDNSLSKFAELFETIEHVDPSVDYDRFCKINKDNEKRKALSAFFINLMNVNIIPKKIIIQTTQKLINTLCLFISMENKKNEVDELAENIAILYKQELYENNSEEDLIHGETIPQVIHKIAKSDIKTYPSITKKTIFKFMDLVDM